MKNIYFIRIVQSEANTGDMTKPNKEINLTQIAIQQAEKIDKMLKVITTKIFVSEYYKTQ